MDQTTDLTTRFVFDQMPVRGIHTRLDGVWRHIAGLRQYPAAVRQALGELTAACVLLAGNMKREGRLIMQIQGKGRLKMLVAETTSAHTCRATAHWDTQADFDDAEGLPALLGDGGVFAITLRPDEGEPWQGIVPLEGGGIAAMLENHMRRSEQVETRILLAADENRAAGLLLQKLPEEDGQGGWEHTNTLAATLRREELLELDAQHLLYRLFHQTPPRVFTPDALEFACTCSRGKVSDLLLLLGADEVGAAVAEEGSIAVSCDFCNSRYVFDETDVHALFGSDIVHAERQIHRIQ
ncbi:MAG: Hsp33 family molecular chaperone HslO [Neisseria sp.]|nr:Hsp33 family molecular chaperone HslO [Neisseria sp.]